MPRAAGFRPSRLIAVGLTVGLLVAGAGPARAAGAFTSSDARIVVETGAHRLVLCERAREVAAYSAAWVRSAHGATIELR